MILVVRLIHATQQHSWIGDNWSFQQYKYQYQYCWLYVSDNATSIIIWTSVIPILVSVTKLQRYRYLHHYPKLSNMYTDTWYQWLKTYSYLVSLSIGSFPQQGRYGYQYHQLGLRDTYTDTSISSWEPAILIPILVLLTGAQ